MPTGIASADLDGPEGDEDQTEDSVSAGGRKELNGERDPSISSEHTGSGMIHADWTGLGRRGASWKALTNPASDWTPLETAPGRTSREKESYGFANLLCGRRRPSDKA